MCNAESKTCTRCEISKPIEEFSWKSKEKNLRHHQCRGCKRIYGKAHYFQNKTEYVDKAKAHNEEYRQRNLIFVTEHLRNRCCQKCGATEHLIAHDGCSVNGNALKFILSKALSIPELESALNSSQILCSTCVKKVAIRQPKVRRNQENIKPKEQSSEFCLDLFFWGKRPQIDSAKVHQSTFL